MSSLKIAAVLLLSTLSTIKCSLLAPVPALGYTQVAPPSILPFSAQVSTFSRNLNVFDAPYAAGVIPGPPAIVQRSLFPGSYAPAPIAPVLSNVAPVFPNAAPVLPNAAPVFSNIAPVLPNVAPVFPNVASAYPPGLVPYAGGLVDPVARSVYAVAPGIAPPVVPAPLLG